MFERKLGIFYKIKSKIPDFEREKAKVLTTGIYYIFRGLKLETDADLSRSRRGIGQKGAFFKGLTYSTLR